LWCRDTGLDPVSCPLQDIRQYFLGAGWAASTLKVYVAAISVNYGHIDGRPVVAQFLHGARRLRRPRVKQASA